ncbi:MAG TPA: Clp protease N-terminal domain-containing protein [Streptosporangiaceae bacterium]|jgi:ATP-dependent Clp protease ATP-binding subunit ClpA
MVFERFHQDARDAVARAREEAAGLGHQQIGSEDLLLGLLTGPGVAAEALAAAGADAAGLRSRISRSSHEAADGPPPLDAGALASIGIDLDAVRRASDAAFGPGSLDRVRAQRRARRPAGDKRMTREAKQALELALRSAVRLGHRHISAGHVLLGILAQPASPAVAALSGAGVNVSRLRQDVTARMAAAA